METSKRMFDLDILSATPFLNIYTQICLCYKVSDTEAYPTIINTLKDGLDRLYTAFPWLSGNIVNVGSGEGNTGLFAITQSLQQPALVVKDLRDETSGLEYSALHESKFPIKMLHESPIAPRTPLLGPL